MDVDTEDAERVAGRPQATAVLLGPAAEAAAATATQNASNTSSFRSTAQ
jgi:hypothetical protein